MHHARQFLTPLMTWCTMWDGFLSRWWPDAPCETVSYPADDLMHHVRQFLTSLMTWCTMWDGFLPRWWPDAPCEQCAVTRPAVRRRQHPPPDPSRWSCQGRHWRRAHFRAPSAAPLLGPVGRSCQASTRLRCSETLKQNVRLAVENRRLYR